MVSIIYSVIVLVSFVSGLIFGLKLANNNYKVVSPIQEIKQNKAKKEVEKQMEETELYYSNIENYPYNQHEFK